MRSYVCAQCHAEYYFKGDQTVLTFPWSKGVGIEQIEEHYDTYGFTDWRHGETGAPMLKMQHPDFEMYSSGIHARSGVACADCHMPYVRDGAALEAAINALVAAQQGGATNEELQEARQLHRRASMRWDFVFSENSTGFHSAQESARILANAIDFARQAQLAAERVTLQH